MVPQDSSLAEIDGDLLKDFLDDFSEKQRNLERDLMQLESDPSNEALLAEVFRAVHTIKGNAGFCKMDPVCRFAHVLEELLQALRSGRIFFSAQLSEVVLLSMDRLEGIVHHFIAGEAQEVELNSKIEESLKLIAEGGSGEIYSLVQYTLCQLSDSFEDLGGDFDLSGQVDESEAELSSQLERELDYFYLLMRQSEQRSIFWLGRGERALALAMEMNALAGSPIPPYKLTAAIYLHDFAMGLLPEFVIAKHDKFSDEEMRLLRNHPVIAAQLVECTSEWSGVSEMVLQHHERIDGEGYPQGLKEGAICEGAKLISIVDAYVSQIRPRADRLHKRSVMQAMLEINKNKGTQFSEDWVKVLNTVIKHRYLKES